MRIFSKLTILSVSIVAILQITSPSPVEAAAIFSNCEQVESVFVPGSGQNVGELSRESDSFRSEVDKYIEPIGIRNNFYRLGTEYQGTSEPRYRYPAVEVAGGWNVINGIGAGVSFGGAFKYGQSVNDGVEEYI